ncbi:5-oxoprolinase subunit PxpA [Marinobacter sp.]|uniref:5-oxoprolinase subunit PxpA n=1 Tax=Marinobacter sp. TaxID=50741 RepID=UPI00356784B0
MKLNCDLGESFGAWTMGQDEAVMPWIDMANIACGFHASDPSIMASTVNLALQHDVEIGAHPSYQDLVGFGRRSIAHSPAEIRGLIWYQTGALDGICRAHGATVSYVKPHGALNNDMMKDGTVLQAVMEAVASFREGLPLMLPVTLQADDHRDLARRVGLPVIFEAFADRAYDDEGHLVSRREAGSVHDDPEVIVRQAMSLVSKGGLYSHTGRWLPLAADSLCVHGDGASALEATRAIRRAISGHQASA